MKHLEDQHCQALWNWAQHVPTLRDYLYHIPNGGKRNAREAARFKSMGVRPGVSDYHLPVPRGDYVGLYLEMKQPKGRETQAQQDWGEAVTAIGHCYRVCHGWPEAKDVLEWYLNLEVRYDPKMHQA